MTDIREEAGAIVEALGPATAGKWMIRVICAGLSRNGNFYPDAALRDAVPLFNGARVFEKSDAEHLRREGKSVRNLIGGLSNTRFVEGAGIDAGEIVSELTVIEPYGPVASKLRHSFERGLSGLFGFSIDAEAVGRVEMREEGSVRRVSRLTKVNSVDLIVDPGAGGELVAALEAAVNETDMNKEQAGMELRQMMIDTIKETRLDYTGEGVPDEQLLQDYRDVLAEGQHKGDKAEGKKPASIQEAVRERARAIISSVKLPVPAKNRLLKQFDQVQGVVSDREVFDAIEAERQYLASVSESGKVRVPGFEDFEVEDRSTKMADMLDAFFDPNHKNHRHVQSFRECYVEITGDRDLTGNLRNCDLSRLRESVGMSLREAVASTSWANVLGDAITRRMLNVYAGETDLQAWRKVASISNVTDFRTQERLRVGGYGNLPGVAESAAYPALASPAEAKATYAVAKRGGIEVVTLEALANDDVQAIRNIPSELALAAANTLYEFVFDFFRTNPEIYDEGVFFDVSRGNLFNTALSPEAFAAHRLAMVKQTRRGSEKRLGLKPRTLLVPFDLEEVAFNLFVREQNIDPDFVQNIKPEVITVAYWADPNDWCTVADPAKLSAVEVGFLNGHESPELFVQDMPNAGSLFSNDQVTYKIRHIYGGTVPVDGEKAATKSVVA